jgi:hypothetical protein
LSAAARNVRAFEVIAPQKAPDPVRYGDTPARPARQQIYQSLAIAPIRAVMQDTFLVRMDAPNPQAAMLRGNQQPWIERRNVQSFDPEAYGNTVPPLLPLPQ